MPPLSIFSSSKRIVLFIVLLIVLTFVSFSPLVERQYLNSLLLHIVIVLSAFFIVRKFKLGEVEAFLGALIFAVYPFNVEVVAEGYRISYLAMLMLCFGGVFIMGRFYLLIKNQEVFIQYLFKTAIVVLILGLMLLTFNKAMIWRDPLSLWTYKVKIAPSAFSYEHLGKVYQDRGQYEQASYWYVKALAIDPKNKQALLGSGELDLQMNKSHESINAFKQVLKIYPDDEGVYISIVDAYSKAIANAPQEKIYQEQREDVLSMYEELSKRKKYNAVDYFNLGFLYEQVGGYEEAIRFYKKSLELNPTYEKSLYNLANRYQEMGEFKAALISYQHLVHFHPKFALGYLNMGIIYNSLGDVAHARMLYQKTLDVDPANAGAYFNLGYLNEAAGDLKDALNYYEKAVESDPQLAEGYYNLGNVYASLGQLPEAIASYLKTVSINKGHQNAFVNLSILSFKSRDFIGAIRYLEQAKLLGYTPPVEYVKSLEPYRQKK